MAASKSTSCHKHVVMFGRPGAGKTTLVKKVCEQLTRRKVAVRGFYTEEVRGSRGERVGFDVVNLLGAAGGSTRAPLARRGEPEAGGKTPPPKVGQYFVHLKSFESVVLPILQTSTQDGGVLVMDEVGKMELLSDAFTKAVEQRAASMGSRSSTTAILVTLPMSTAGNAVMHRFRTHPAAAGFLVDNASRSDPGLLENILKILAPTASGRGI